MAGLRFGHFITWKFYHKTKTVNKYWTLVDMHAEIFEEKYINFCDLLRFTKKGGWLNGWIEGWLDGQIRDKDSILKCSW